LESSQAAFVTPENPWSAQSIQISPSKVLTAMRDGRAWLVELPSSRVTALSSSAVAAERSSMAASFVEAAICAGLTQTTHPPGPYTLPRYLRWLAGNYVFAGQTPGLFRRAVQRFAESGRPDLADFALKKAEEEDGHAELAGHDLEALGVPLTETIRAIEPPSASIFADRFRAYVESRTPVALFGFSYCLERMADRRDEAFIRSVQAICPPDCPSFRFLKVHSKIGSDHKHVDEQLAFFDSLPPSDLTVITCAAYETAELLDAQSSMDQALTDEEIGCRLRQAGIPLSFSDTQLESLSAAPIAARSVEDEEGQSER
jgi:hypothetical protein